MGLDLGKARTGVAISDPTQTIVSPVATIDIENENNLTSEIEKCVEEYKPEILVVGIPTLMDGSRGSMAKWAEKIRRELQKHLETLETPEVQRRMKVSETFKVSIFFENFKVSIVLF